MERPEIVTDEMLEFLDDLRDSGVTNMYGAAPYLKDEFYDLSMIEAREVTSYWMKTFGNPLR
jgi:hypothetical protein